MASESAKLEKLETTLTVEDLAVQPPLILAGTCRRWFYQLSYAIQYRRWFLSIIFIAAIVLAGGIIFIPAWRFSAAGIASAPPDVTEWLSRIQNVVGFFTLFVAVAVWLAELRQDWEETLPNRMSVFFFLDDQNETAGKVSLPRLVIVSRNVWLAGEDDLRQWGMQVAGQAVTAYVKVPNPNQLRLDFGPDVIAGEGHVLTDSDGTPHRHYSIRFKLTRLPDPLKQVWCGFANPVCLYQNLAEASSKLRLAPVDQVIAALKTQPDWTELPQLGF